ncbi:LOW QUALITY PROTEIN: hypothetical protein ACHAWF_010347 [Thalassiosira exigua]
MLEFPTHNIAPALVVVTFAVVSVIVTVLTHTFFRQMETDVLRGQFAEISATLLSITTKDLERKAGSARALSMMYTSLLGEELADNPDPTNYPPSVMLSPEASMCAATIVDQGGHWRTPWPYVTLPGHDRIGSALLDASGSRAGVFAALLNGKEGGVGTETTEWEAYATENALPLVKDVVANGIRISNSSTADMSGGHDQGHRDMAGTVLPMLRAPAWQVAPAEMMQEGIMWDYFSHLPYRDAIERILQFGAVEEIDEDEMTTAIHEDRGEGDAIMAAITELIPCTDTLLPLHLNPRRKEDPIEIKRADGHLHNHHEHRDLSDGLGEFCSAIFYPVYNAPLSSATPRIISGVVSEVFQWSDILQNIINPNAKFHKLRVVIESCLALPDGGCRPSAATYEINHLTGAHALGPGRITEPQHEPMVQSYNFSLPNDESMTYTIDVYPTDELCYEMGVSKEPIYLSIVAACFFLLSIIVFFVYDYFVNFCLLRWLISFEVSLFTHPNPFTFSSRSHRQKVVVRSAARSARIVRSLYPQFVRDNLFRPEGQHIRSDDRGAAVCIEAGHTGSTKEYDEEDPRSGSGNNDRALGLPTRRSSENGGFGGETRRKRGLKSKVSDFVDTPATQLRRFLTHPMPSHEYDYGLYREIGGVEPIAEVFEKTTVMLADIEGFTAWCSEREPSQVFRLLETVYREFDIEARKLGVFKVETVGDCYVAVTGLPDPRDDHAIVIAKYAVRCLLKFNVLTKRLEANLGPGTASLGMRFGLHSGPVMAGVLRGEKSRFQLFGDTINVASRMESTGEKNMIQASQDTADLLNASGKGHWLTPREGPVSAKGKGAIQTYWLQPNRRRPSMHGSLRASMSSTDSTHSTTPAVSLARALRQSWKCIGIDNDSLVAKERLIRWNAAILESFLLKIVDNRNAHSPPDMLQEQFIPSPEDKILSFSEKLSETVMFPDVAYRDDYYGVSSDIAISSEAQLELLEYVARIASMYRDVPFHNFDHASHVTMSANKLLNRVCTTFEDEEEDIASVAARTFGISADPLAQFVVVFSSLVHDVDHQGVPNAQLVKENDPLAAEFDNRSVAEKRSITLAWNILMQDRFLELQLLIFVNGDELRRFKQLLINTVLATDIADKERSRRGKSRWQKAFHPSQSSRGSAHLDESISSRLDEISLRSLKATLVFEQIMQASDVAHTMQHWETFKKWNERLYTELSKGFREGRGASDPRENWYGGEIGFFDFYIIPLAKKLKECGVFGSAASEYLDYALENRRRWEVEGNDIATRMIAENDALVASEAQKEAALINESPAKEEKMRPPEDESSPQNVANKNPCPQNEETTTKVGTPREVTTNDDLGEIV